MPSVSRLPNVKIPDVALYTALSVKAPPPRRVWISGGATHETLVSDVIKGVFAFRPYPRGMRRSPLGVPLMSWLTMLVASWAWMVAGSGEPAGVVLLIHV